MKGKKMQIRNSTADFLVFTKDSGSDSIEVRVQDHEVWLTQKSLGQLFDVDRSVITKHLKNVFQEGELDETTTCANFAQVADNGRTYHYKFYSLPAIIAVGYRINSTRATQFRQWATKVLDTFTRQGYVLDKDRLINGQIFDEDYFEHLISEIQEIRASERRFYQKITDIYATAVDYSVDSKTTNVYDREKAFTLSLPDDGFLKGVTHDGHDIAIYCGSPEKFGTLEIPSYYKIRTSTYIVQCGNQASCDWSHFEAIEFRGGTLNDLFTFSASTLANCPKSIESNTDFRCLSGTISTPYGNIKVTIGKIPHEHHGPDEYSFSNRTVYLQLLFSKSIKLNEIFHHIENVNKLIFFLTSHKNIIFDEMYLLKWHDECCQVFDDAQIFQEPSVTPVQKTPWHNLCFDELNGVVFSLLQLIYSNIPNNPFCFMDFLPSSPQDVGRMSTDIIHSIVTCLECELARVKMSNSTPDNKSTTYLAESDKLSSLIKELKKTICSFEEENRPFPRKTHDTLMGVFKHLTLADADKFYLTYEKYIDILRLLFFDTSSIPNREDIENLVIHRNRTTHGTQQILDKRLCETAFYLIGLIYCMILHSLGVDDTQLKKLCQKHFLSE